MMVVNGGAAGATTYFVDSVGGDDNESGTRVASAWKTIDKVNSTTFQPGDRILLKCGGVWKGQLHPKGSGADGNPIVLDKYGQGSAPLIAGEGAPDAPVSAALYLYNQEYWDIRNIEITNFAGDGMTKFGVYVQAEDYGTVDHIHMVNLVVHDVDGDLTLRWNGGIFWEVTGRGTPTNFNDILVEGCHVYDVDRVGISSQSIYRERTLTKNLNWLPSTNIVVRNNLVERCGGNAVVVRVAKGALIEHNVFANNSVKVDGNSNYPFNSDDSVIQFNEAYGTKWEVGTVDGSGFDSDYGCKNTVIQYNYSHDNDRGFCLVCNNTDGIQFNDGSTVRYNISQNDGGVGQEGQTFRIVGNPTNTVIYNNVVYIGPGRTTRPVWYKKWGTTDTGANGTWAQGVTYYNNIFYNLGTGDYVFGYSKNNVFDYNIFYGTHPANEPDDPHKITDDPKFVAPGTGATGLDTVDGYKLEPDSPAIDSGTVVHGHAESDFWGNPVPYAGAVDRGAYEYGSDAADR